MTKRQQAKLLELTNGDRFELNSMTAVEATKLIKGHKRLKVLAAKSIEHETVIHDLDEKEQGRFH